MATTTTPMASAILTPPYSSSLGKPTTLCSLSTCLNSNPPKNPNFHSFKLGLTPFSSWNGLRQQAFSISQNSFRLERRRKCKGKVVFASLFGVGAPEALVIGVVALLVFGPKGLAEVARNLGKTLRAFQPTIRELQEVSREFKSTLEKEIGLDEIQSPLQNNYNSNTISSSTPASPSSPVTTPEDSQSVADPDASPPTSKAYSSEDYLKVTEEQLKASAALQQKEQTTSSPAETPSTPQTQSQDSVQEVATTTTPAEKPKIET